MCTNVLCAFLVPGKVREGVRSPDTGIKDDLKLHVKAGNRTWVLCKNKCCKLECLLFSPWR